MIVKVVLQGLTLLVLFQTLLYLTFRLYSGSEEDCTTPTRRFQESVSVLCEKCRLNVEVEVSDSDFLTSTGLELSDAGRNGKGDNLGRNVSKNHSEVIENKSANNDNKNQISLTSRKNILVGLKNIMKSMHNVFFVESRCGTVKLAREFNHTLDFVLTARQSCAVESAARANPLKDVYVVHTCPLGDDFLSRAPETTRRLLELQNVHIVRLSLTELFKNSPVQQLFESGRMDDSEWPVYHASDVIRILLLWRFGGTYLDLDTVNIRPLVKLGTNFAGFQDTVVINNAVMSLGPFGYGHGVCTKYLQYLNSHFDGKRWAANGPDVITEIVNKDCGRSSEVAGCDVFTVFHPSVFYQVYYPGFRRFFDTGGSRELIRTVKATAFSVHFWNKMSKDLVVKVGSNQTYALLAEEFCPGVYRNCGPTF